MNSPFPGKCDVCEKETKVWPRPYTVCDGWKVAHICADCRPAYLRKLYRMDEKK